MTLFPSQSCSQASQINLRLEAQAKSRTLSALKTQVLVVVGLFDSLVLASSGVTTKTGLSELLACSSLFCCSSVSGVSLSLINRVAMETPAHPKSQQSPHRGTNYVMRSRRHHPGKKTGKLQQYPYVYEVAKIGLQVDVSR